MSFDLVKCPKCGQKRYDPGIGCERRACAHVKPEDASDVGSTSTHDPDGKDATPAGGYVCDNPEGQWIADQKAEADARGDE